MVHSSSASSSTPYDSDAEAGAPIKAESWNEAVVIQQLQQHNATLQEALDRQTEQLNKLRLQADGGSHTVFPPRGASHGPR